MSDQSIARQMYAKQYAMLEKRRKTATTRPLTQREISVLMESRWNGQPVCDSAEKFYSEEYMKLLRAKMQPIGKDDLARLLEVKNRNGDAKYRAEDFRSSDGKYRTLTEEEARDLLGLEQVVKYRPATPEEANIIYCDIHSRIVKDGLERENS